MEPGVAGGAERDEQFAVVDAGLTVMHMGGDALPRTHGKRDRRKLKSLRGGRESGTGSGRRAGSSAGIDRPQLSRCT
jgi:hypothetical protein